jgi:hypothetical protein
VLADLLAAAKHALANFDDLVSDSNGVYGLHLNGDDAPWSDLLPGGRYEEWTRGIEDLRDAIDRTARAGA